MRLISQKAKTQLLQCYDPPLTVPLNRMIENTRLVIDAKSEDKMFQEAACGRKHSGIG